MSYIYAMSDIHGHLGVFKEALKNVDFTTKGNKLILLGDYIDGGKQSYETLCFIQELSKSYPNQVIALRGNHEEMFLEQLSNKNYVFYTDSYNEMQNYLTKDELSNINNKINGSLTMSANITAIYKEMIALIKLKHKDLLTWLKALPYYYTTENQIFVHAGVDEEAGRDWKWGTSDEEFVWKYPPTLGKFYKDIISGHTYTSEIANDKNYHKVFWDKESHFFIDGETIISKVIPLLKYDTNKQQYSSFEKIIDENGNVYWLEYLIK